MATLSIDLSTLTLPNPRGAPLPSGSGHFASLLDEFVASDPMVPAAVPAGQALPDVRQMIAAEDFDLELDLDLALAPDLPALPQSTGAALEARPMPIEPLPVMPATPTRPIAPSAVPADLAAQQSPERAVPPADLDPIVVTRLGPSGTTVVQRLSREIGRVRLTPPTIAPIVVTAISAPPIQTSDTPPAPSPPPREGAAPAEPSRAEAPAPPIRVQPAEEPAPPAATKAPPPEAMQQATPQPSADQKPRPALDIPAPTALQPVPVVPNHSPIASDKAPDAPHALSTEPAAPVATLLPEAVSHRPDSPPEPVTTDQPAELPVEPLPGPLPTLTALAPMPVQTGQPQAAPTSIPAVPPPVPPIAATPAAILEQVPATPLAPAPAIDAPSPTPLPPVAPMVAAEAPVAPTPVQSVTVPGERLAGVPPAPTRAEAIPVASPTTPPHQPTPPTAPSIDPSLMRLVSGISTDRDEPAAEPNGEVAPSIGAVQSIVPAASPSRIEPAAVVAQAQAVDTDRADWIEALVDRIDGQRGQGRERVAHIRLTPDALGIVEVRIRHDGDQAHVSFSTETAQARALIAEAAPRLAELADARGIRLGDSSVAQQQQQGGQRQPAERTPTNDAPAPAAADPDTDDSADDPADRIA